MRGRLAVLLSLALVVAPSSIWLLDRSSAGLSGPCDTVVGLGVDENHVCLDTNPIATLPVAVSNPNKVETSNITYVTFDVNDHGRHAVLTNESENWTTPSPAPPAPDDPATPNGSVGLVHLETPMTPEWRSLLTEHNVTVLAPLVHNWFVADNATDASDLAVVDEVDPLPPEWKLQRGITNATGDVAIHVMAVPNLAGALSDTQQAIRDLGGTVNETRQRLNVTTATLPAENLTALAEEDSVLRIERAVAHALAMDHIRNVTGAESLHAGELGSSPGGYTGHNVSVLVTDDGLDTDHLELVSSLAANWSPDGSVEELKHGTKSFGVIMADGDPDNLGHGIEGIAPNATGVFAGKQYNEDDRTSMMLLRNERAERFTREYPNASVASYAVGSPGETHRDALPVSNPYGLFAYETDTVAYLQDVLVVQAMHNDGEGDAFHNAMAKNAMSVGGVYHAPGNLGDADLSNDIWTHDKANEDPASTGPSLDCRIKPDLVGPYDNVKTTTKGDSKQHYSKTSAATSVVSGAATLTYQMYKEGALMDAAGDPTEGLPSSALVKALMANTAHTYDYDQVNQSLEDEGNCGDASSADSIEARHARDVQGWGFPRVDVLQENGSVTQTLDERFSLVTGDVKNFTADLPSWTEAVRVSLAWTDPPGTPLASTINASQLVADDVDQTAPPALVNDVDLELQAPNGTTYVGNHGMMNDNRSNPAETDLTDRTELTTITDRRNNVEQVFVRGISDSETDGDWIVSVKAAAVNAPGSPSDGSVDQPFSLVLRPIDEVPEDDGDSCCCCGGGGDDPHMLPAQ